jgi:hypothetical protein
MPPEFLMQLNIWFLIALGVVIAFFVLLLFICSLTPPGRRFFDSYIHYQDQIDNDRFKKELRGRLENIEANIRELNGKIDNHLKDHK